MLDEVDDARLASRQDALQREATEVLAALVESAALSAVGELVPTGSHVSGLMCWPDLDVGALVGPDFAPTDVVNLVGGVVAAFDVTDFTYRDERGERSPTGERRDERYHVPISIVWDATTWRFDLSLWLYDDHAHVTAFHRQLAERVSPEQRRAILRIKDVWCRMSNYPDEISGLDIYTAVLDHGIRTPDEFGAWLDQAGSKASRNSSVPSSPTSAGPPDGSAIS